jgi:hypothetical protein
MEVTAHPLRGRGEHAGYGGIGALQGRELKLSWGVGMLQEINQLLLTIDTQLDIEVLCS